MPLLKRRWSLLAKAAEDRGVRIAFEPWPGSITGYGPYEWYNSAVTPEMWERLFDAVPSKALGLEYDPSHLLWQQVDYLRAVRDFGDRIYHVHAKDTKIDRDNRWADVLRCVRTLLKKHDHHQPNTPAHPPSRR